MKRVRAAALCFLVCIALAGCGGKVNPKLMYQPVTGPSESCPASFTVVQFDLKVDDSQVGETSDGEGIYTDDDIADWVSSALNSELQDNQCMSLIHDREYYPISDFIILGSVDKLWVHQRSMTDYEAELALTVTLKKGDQAISTETVQGRVERTVVPGKDVVRALLEEVLQDVMRTVVPKILVRAENAK